MWLQQVQGEIIVMVRKRFTCNGNPTTMQSKQSIFRARAWYYINTRTMIEAIYAQCKGQYRMQRSRIKGHPYKIEIWIS